MPTVARQVVNRGAILAAKGRGGGGGFIGAHGIFCTNAPRHHKFARQCSVSASFVFSTLNSSKWRDQRIGTEAVRWREFACTVKVTGHEDDCSCRWLLPLGVWLVIGRAVPMSTVTVRLATIHGSYRRLPAKRST